MKPEVEMLYYLCLGKWPRQPNPQLSYLIVQVGSRCDNMEEFIRKLVYILRDGNND